MTDLLIAIVIVGTASTYIIEFLDLLTRGFFGVPILNKALSLPLSIGGLYLLDIVDITLVVATPATAFVTLMISKFINRPVATTVPRLRGLG
jgi:hypothetical protein